DCLEAIRVDLRSGSDVEQKVAEANVQGRVMDLPAGELRFAAGAHYRENNFDYRVDGLNNYRSFLDSAAGLFPSSDSQGSTRAREVYTEFLIPALSGIEVGDVSVIQELNFEAGFRYSDMEPSGSIETWKVLFDWQINDWARLRGGKQVANRAPNIAELYQSPTQGFGFSFIGDLCSENNTHPLSAAPANANGATVRAMC